MPDDEARKYKLGVANRGVLTTTQITFRPVLFANKC